MRVFVFMCLCLFLNWSVASGKLLTQTSFELHCLVLWSEFWTRFANFIYCCFESFFSSFQDQITYHQVSGIKLSRGLYLCYLKMRSSVDLLQVLVPSKSPNILPHCKVRDNPHVNALVLFCTRKQSFIQYNFSIEYKFYYIYYWSVSFIILY